MQPAEIERLTRERNESSAEAARLRGYNEGLAKIGAELEADNERLRAALTALVSCFQTNHYPSPELETEAVDLCGGMDAVRAYEQRVKSDRP